jgi:hypothetical protein
MKKIYLFEYQFKQDKRGLLNYKTFIVIKDNDFENTPTEIEMQSLAYKKFKDKLPHVDIKTVDFSEFRGDMIDSWEVV